MPTKLKPQSRIAEAVLETAGDLHRLGFITKRRMSEYDALCLTPVPEYDASRVLAIRTKHKISQTVLAAALNTSASTVRSWEGGAKKPNGTAAKLLNLIERKGLEAIL